MLLFTAIRSVVLLLVFNSCVMVLSAKYYITQKDIKNQLEEMKKATKDPISTSNSNVYYIDEAAESHEASEVGIEQEKPYEQGYVAIPEKKHSKFLSEEITFAVVVVTLAVFLCFLSSLIVPLTLLVVNGGLLPFGGLGLNGILNPLGNIGGNFGGVTTGVGMGRKRRSLENIVRNNTLHHYFTRFELALKKFNSL